MVADPPQLRVVATIRWTTTVIATAVAAKADYLVTR